MQQALNNYSYYNVLYDFLYSLTHKLDGKTFGWTTEFRFGFQRKKVTLLSLRSLIMESDSGPFKAYLNWLMEGRPRPLDGQVVSLHQSALWIGGVDSPGRGWGACDPPL